MIYWPNFLPYPELKSYKVEVTSNKITTSMETGQTRDRKLYQTRPDIIFCSWLFNEQQFAVFEYFYNVILESATKDFQINFEPSTKQNGTNVKFTAGYKVTRERGGNTYAVSAQLQKSFSSLMSKVEYQICTHVSEIRDLNKQILHLLQGTDYDNRQNSSRI